MKKVKHFFMTFFIILICLSFFSCGVDIFDIFDLFKPSGKYDEKLDIPFVTQQPNYRTHCAPANVTMWAQYDKGITNADTINTIANWFYRNGGLPVCDFGWVRMAVEEFTNSNATWETGRLSNRDSIMSSVVGSFDQKERPSIFMFNGNTHSVILFHVKSTSSGKAVNWTDVEFKV